METRDHFRSISELAAPLLRRKRGEAPEGLRKTRLQLIVTNHGPKRGLSNTEIRLFRRLVGLPSGSFLPTAAIILVDPSNEVLARKDGIGRTQLGEALRGLEFAGLIVRRVCGNGRRRYGQSLIDIGPGVRLVASWAEQSEPDPSYPPYVAKQLRGEISVLRRQIEQLGEEAQQASHVLQEQTRKVRSGRDIPALRHLANEYRAIRDESGFVAKPAEDENGEADEAAMDASQVPDFRHPQYKGSDCISSAEGVRERGRRPALRSDEARRLFPSTAAFMPAGYGDVRRDWHALAATVGSRCGISERQMIEGRRLMDDDGLAICTMLLVERQASGQIRTTASRYWNGMMQRARAGELHIERSLWARRKATTGVLVR